ncbi:helix-turn-helix domain-containing protein [Clostridioides difficile]|nr:helix-turn-helix transcriptional regulator [Clostridioides difficile]UUC43413.1 helix-turn-helix domain-containing protein [Clostridioides difficile]
MFEKTNINTSVMNRIESDERPIRDDELIIFAKIFGISINYILGL